MTSIKLRIVVILVSYFEQLRSDEKLMIHVYLRLTPTLLWRSMWGNNP